MKNRITPSEIEKVNNLIMNAIEYKDNDKYLNGLKNCFYFKGRKSIGISSFIIKNLLSENEIVLDPFAGGGSFLLSALIADKDITGIELDNYTFFALRMVFEQCDLKKLHSLFKHIENKCKNEILNLYKTECCNNTNYIKKFLFDPSTKEYFNPTPNREIKDGMNIHLLYKCPSCLNSIKKFDKVDYIKLTESENKDTSSFPNDKLMENSRINITSSTGSDIYNKFFTKRAQYSLLKIQENISLLDDCIEKYMLQHVLVNTLPLAKIAMYGSSTDILYHVILDKGQEMNVWYLFNDKYEKFLKFKRENIELLSKSEEKLKLINDDYNNYLKNKKIKYDLIYTDFPYTDQVPYLERNQLYRIWLYNFASKADFSFSEFMLKNEIVQTNAAKRKEKSSIESYYKDLDKMFERFYDVLNEDKYIFITIKLGKNKYIQTYSEIINLARKNGFEYVTRIGIEHTNPTLRKQSAYANTLQKEQVVVFKKLSSEERYFYIKSINVEPEIITQIYNLVRDSNNVVTFTEGVSHVSKYLRNKFHLIDNEYYIERIKKIITNNFILEDNQRLKLDNNIYYTEVEDEQTIFIKLYDIIPICIRELLENKGYFEIEDLYLKLTSLLCESDHSVLSKILNYGNHTKEIQELVNSYCEISNGLYIKKEYKNKFFEGSQDVSQFSGREFEILIKNLLEKEGFFNVHIKGGAGDRGVDIIASKLINKEVKRYYLQCKRWVAKVGSEPIQRLFAEKSYNKIDYTICVTTSDFTSEGKIAAKNFDVEMWNGIKVMELLNKHFPKKYFNALIPS